MFQTFVKVQPPHIKWETRSIEKRKLVEEGGGKYFVDVDYAIVTPIGSRDTVEKEVQPWFDHLEMECGQMPPRFDPEWLTKIKESYRRWKQGQEMPVDGTPIKNWPAASPAEVKRMAHVGIRTVEDMAVANEEALNAIGMGAISLKQRANTWLEGQKDLSPIVQKVDALIAEMVALKEQNTALIANNKLLMSEVAARDQMLASTRPFASPAERYEPRQGMKDNEILSSIEQHALDSAVRSLG